MSGSTITDFELSHKLEPSGMCLIKLAQCHAALGNRDELLEVRTRILTYQPANPKEKLVLQLTAQEIQQKVDSVDAELKRRGLKYSPRSR